MEIESYQSPRSALKLYFAFGERKNKKVEERGRRKPLIIWSISTSDRATILTSAITIALTSLLIIGGFLLIISPPLMASALIQDGITTISTATGATATTADTTTETPALPGIESSSAPSQPNVNVTEIPVSDVNGTYMNPNIGFQIDLPTGWSGKEINLLVYSVIAAPGDTNLLEQLALEEPSTYISIMGIDQEGINILENVSELVSSRGQAGGIEEQTLLQGNSEPLGTNTTTSFGDNNTVSCTYLQPSFVTINGINAEESLAECIEEGGETGTIAKTKSYTFATQNNSLIVVGFYANSTGTYDLNLPLFEESARTISISQPAEIATSEIYGRYQELVESQQLSNQTGGRM
jgi:hypothetical protein